MTNSTSPELVMLYTTAESNGVILIIVMSTISLLALFGLLITLINLASKPKFKSTSEYLFLQSNFGLYFISLLFANLIASTGSIMNARWVSRKAVEYGGFCTAQGSVKNIGNVATALWSMVISIHVFNLLFLRHETKKLAGIFMTIGVWCAVFTIDILGPAVLVKHDLGPFFGIAGYWCWITDKYPGARIGLEYFWFFFSGALSLVLYTLVFLRLRGNLLFPEGSRLPRFIWVPKAKAWRLQANRDAVDAHMTDVAKQMIWFPVAYTIVILPIAIERLMGGDPPLEWVVFADSLFMSYGLINVIVFFAIRHALPKSGVLPTFNIPRKPPPSVFIPPPEPKMGEITPFNMGSASSDKTFGTKDRYDRISDVPPLPTDEKVIITNIGGTFRGKKDLLVGKKEAEAEARDAYRNPFASELDISDGNNEEPRRVPVPAPAPSPPVDRHPESRLHSRQNSSDSIQNPFGDDRARSSDSESESEDEYDGYGRKRGRPDSDWQPSLSAYFDNVDLGTARPEQRGFGRDESVPVPPLPAGLVPGKPNRI